MGKKILLADDSITIQKVIELTFSDEDFEVVTVGNGRLAIEKAQEVRPDIVLCDIIMPEKDGYEVCDFIKKNAALAHVPVLLLTGAFEPFDQERAARVGCDGFLAKPFEPQTLIAKVKDLLSQASTRQAPAPAPRPAPPAPAPETYAPVAEAMPVFEPEFETPPVAPAPQPFEPTAPPYAPAAPAFEPASYEPAPVVYEPQPVSYEPAPAAPFQPAPSPVPSAAPVPESSYAEAPPSFADALEMPEPPTAEPYPNPPAEPYSSAAPADNDLYGVADAIEAGPEELMSLSPEPAAPRPVAAQPPADDASTLMFQAINEPAPWSQPTVEVPLETRAQAGVEQMAVDTPVFEEVFEETDVPTLPTNVEPPPPPAPATRHPAPSFAERAPAPVAAMPPPPPAPAIDRPAAVPPAPPPAPVSQAAPADEDLSFAELTAAAQPAEAAASHSSEAAQVSVPMDMVAQIAQRVVAQISERVVREVAWEVIPDLAEALIKKEIERLKAELQQT